MAKEDEGKLSEINLNENETDGDMEKKSGKKLKYPYHVFFILVNEFCERFSYYGMRAILIIYLTEELKQSEDTATVIYHTFIMCSYFTPLFGSMIADSLLGKFRTIFYLSIVYAAGQILLSLAAAEPLHIPQLPFSLIGMMLISIGTGGIKPCVSSFGGDQFKMPEQEDKLASFFSIFYFSINCGSLISTILTPILREDIQCFGNEDSCFPLAFGVPAGLMVASLVIILIGRPWYTMRKPEGNVVWSVLKTIGHALSKKWKRKKDEPEKEHWMDYAEGKYEKRDIQDIKIVLGVLFLYLPLPFFWTLYDQQGSRWTLQATRMKGDLGSYVIKPDQMQVLSSLLILLFIPLFDQGVYPLLGKFGLLKKPLQRLTVGGIFAGISFIISGVVELELQKTYPVEIGDYEGHLQVINMAPWDLNVKLKWEVANQNDENLHLLKDQNYVRGLLPNGTYSLTIDKTDNFDQSQFLFTTIAKNASTILITYNGTHFNYALPTALNWEENDPQVTDFIEKSTDGKPYFRIIQSGLWNDPLVSPPFNETSNEIIENNLKRDVMLVGKKTHRFEFTRNSEDYPDWQSTPTSDVDGDEYDIYILEPSQTEEGREVETLLGKIDMDLGGSYVLAIVNNAGVYKFTTNVLTPPNSMHMLWLIPQYIVLSAGEIMFSITIMDFSYSQAPTSLKAVMQSAWLMTVAFGNLIVVIIAELKFFEQQWKEFFLFAGLMFLDMLVFSYMAYRYKPANFDNVSNSIDSRKDEDEMKVNGVANDSFSDEDD